MKNVEKLEALRNEMRRAGIDIYIVPTSDFHESEYVGEYFKARKYLTGFTGSMGTAVVTLTEAAQWADGRYYIQAEKELEESGFTLMRQGMPGVPTIDEFLEEKLVYGGVIGFDGRVVNTLAARKYEEIAREKHGSLHIDEDLVARIWPDRPGLPDGKIWILPDEYSGESVSSKLSRIRKEMTDRRADMHLVTSLCDIAWILNLRAGDIPHLPVFLSFLLVGMDDAALFVRDEIMTDEVREYLAARNVAVRPYDDIYEALSSLTADTVRAILLNEAVVNFRLSSLIQKDIRVVSAWDPSFLMKAVKNETELKNTRIAHIRDGVAVTKFMYWLKTHVGKEDIDEYTAGEKAAGFRADEEHFLDRSFDNISAYGENAAMMHYQAPKEGSAKLLPEGFYLLDSGGHYLEGTTDITRTIVLGDITPEQKRHFTLVAKANLNLANAKFLYGSRGLNLDILCRGVLWKEGLDYKCGTGHGVGNLLNVHEGPQGFRWQVVPDRIDSGVFEPGMITSDEPGIYLEGRYGIRTENELICIEDEVNEWGRFLKFENITMAPIDLDGIDPELLSPVEKEELNSYHRDVFEKISPYFCGEELEWLKTYTRAI